MPNKKKKQSTGSYAGNRDQHEGLQKEKKKDKPTWRPKNETVKQRQVRTSQPSFIESVFGLAPKKKGK